MKIMDLHVGDILISNGKGVSINTRMASASTWHSVVTGYDRSASKANLLVFASTDTKFIGMQFGITSKELCCFVVKRCESILQVDGETESLYLTWDMDGTSIGRIGEPSPFTDDYGNQLCVGDTVTVTHDFRSWHKRVVVHEKTLGYYIMGIKKSCDEHRGKIFNYEVKKDSDCSERGIGERLPCCDGLNIVVSKNTID